MVPDRISELPDSLLIEIVSLFKIKESGKTSVLSKRWKHLWENMTILNFDANNIIGTVNVNKFCEMVDRVLGLHKASIIDEFRVNYSLTKHRKEQIDNWIRILVEKKVKNLKLHIVSFQPFPVLHPYHFPSLSLGNWLKSIELASVNMSGEYVETLLNECKLLEVMSIENSSLVELKVAGPLKLKYLRIDSCLDMKLLEISAPNLTSFCFVGSINKCYTVLTLSSCSKLTSLDLANIDVNGKYLEKLLYDCPFLEVMSIKNCYSLVNLKVAGPSLSLKSFKLISYSLMKHLEISAPNLTCCCYIGPELENSPFKSPPN